ncbi:hypothetical protein [Sphingomonas abaci]|uniref:Uncharacterized protein n=1 Tax=Sphingomonas abaci TaxID=237611 RepID=A0A7W7AJ30_9SPHN|nr:hypothetical protein [Sphingomonas abaci]MBB4617976.1 hypothetical protein [Sphingomonas abaci]
MAGFALNRAYRRDRHRESPNRDSFGVRCVIESGSASSINDGTIGDAMSRPAG